MQDTPFYFHTSRNLLVAIGDLFNEISVTRSDTDGNIVQTTKVPISISRKQKFLARLREDIRKQGGDQANIEIALPRLSYDFVSFDPDPTRMRSGTGYTKKINTAGDVLKQLNPIPYTVGIELTAYTYTVDEMLQILEQISPYFKPDFNLTLIEIPEMEDHIDIPLILDGVGPDDTFEGSYDDQRLIQWSFAFTAKTFIYPPIEVTGVIKKALITMIDDTTDRLRELEKITVYVDPLTANEDDPHNIVTTIETMT